MTQYDQMFDLKLTVDHSDIYFMVSDFAIYFKDYLMNEYNCLG